MLMLADVVDAVVGGDTHRDSHTLEIAHPSGVPIATCTVSNDAAGYAEALAFIAQHAPGPRVAVAVEGTRSYGIGLARAVSAAGLDVLEIGRAARGQSGQSGQSGSSGQVRRAQGKSDRIDAHLAVLQAVRLPADRLPTPRADGEREALRILLGARRELTGTKTRQINRLRALLLGGDDADRALARGTLTQTRLARIAGRRGRVDDPAEVAVRRDEARRLAVAIREAHQVLATNKKQLADLVEQLAPGLTSHVGIGPSSAAQALVSWSHPGRCRDQAAFAALAGASPLPASSGRTVRHRHNRGGDRQLNKALHDIALTRWRMCPRTHAYIARRRAEGKTDREIRRCLKRYVARELFGHLQATITP